MPATPAGRVTSLVATALAAVIGGAAIGIVIGLRLANKDVTPNWEKWWIFAWLVVGVIDAVIGAALVTRYGHRRLGGCLIVTGAAALMVAVATQARYSTLDDPDSGWAMLAGAKDWATRSRSVCWRRCCPGSSPARAAHATEVIWWITAVMIALVAVAEAADLGHPAIDAVYFIAVSATLATPA